MESLQTGVVSTKATSTCIDLIEQLRYAESYDDDPIHRSHSTNTNGYGFHSFSLFLTLPYLNYTESMQTSFESERKTATSLKLNSMHTHAIFTMVRMRGGAPELSTNFDGTLFSIESLDAKKFRWNGLPHVEFPEHVIAPFRAGLMQVGDRDASLWQTAKRTDPGGTLGTPAAGGLNPATPADAIIIAGNALRKLKLFGTICNYTFSGSESYKMFMADYNSDGPAVWEFIESFGALPMPRRYIRAREETWNLLTYDKLKLPYTITGYFKYLDILKYHARKLNIDPDKQKEKFITGLPAFMESSATNMRHSTHNFPATYGAIPRYASAPFAGTAHPQQGQPNIDALARAYLIDFFEKAAHTHGATPDGVVNMVLSAEVDEVDVANAVVSTKITPDFKCYWCGGFGHAVSVLLPGGKVAECPSKMLGFPSVNSTPGSGSGGNSKQSARSVETDESIKEIGNAISEMGAQLCDVQEQVSAIQKSFRPRRAPRGTSPVPRRNAHTVSDFDEEDDTSPGSEVDDISSIAQMADKPKAKFRRPLPRSKD